MQAGNAVFPRWLIVTAAVTLLLLLYNIPDLYDRMPETWKHRRGSFLVLYEMNYPTWWTGTLLLAAGLLFLESAFTREPAIRTPCIVLAALNAGLSLDEIGSIHERVGLFSYEWLGDPWTALMPFAAVGLLGLGYGIRGLLASTAGRRGAVFSSCGFATFGIVVLMEYLEHHPRFPAIMMKSFGITPGESIVVEEVTEMVGAMLVLVGASLVRSEGTLKPELGFVLSRPTNIPVLGRVLAAGLGAHCVAAFFLLPDARDLLLRGNPAAWYPSAVFFIAMCHCYWQCREARCAGAAWAAAGWFGAGLFCLLCSIGFLHAFGHLVGLPLMGLQKPFFFNIFVIYAVLVVSITALVTWLKLWSAAHPVYLALLLLAPAVEFGVSDRGSGFAASGILAFATASILLAARRETGVEE